MQLHPYQIEGINFALKFRNALIADEMGLGKTAQAIGVINARTELRSVLIICPLSLKLNWRAELSTWLSDEMRDVCSINVVHYEQLPKLRKTAYDQIVIDEAHYIKNPTSARCKVVKAITKTAKHTLMLTGTPFVNRPRELWPLLQILDAKTWDSAGKVRVKGPAGKWISKSVGAGEGAGFFTFGKHFCGGVQETIGWDSAKGRPKTAWNFDGASNLDELKDWLAKTGYIRRLKADVLPQLPPKTRQLILFEAPKASLCDDTYSGISDEQFLATIAKLTASKVAFTEWSKKRKEQAVAKVPFIIEHIQRCIENGSEKIILFAHHDDVIQSLAKELVFTGMQFMTSKNTAAERQGAVDVFNDDPNCKVIIGSLGVMGVGYTMVVSDHVVFAEVDPVPGRMWQGEDRAHRFGQKKGVLVQYAVFDNTIEARICKIYAKKSDVLKAVLG